MTKDLIDPYNKLNILIKYGKGSYVYDQNDKKYLDFISGVAVLAFGHCHPKLVDTLNKQSLKLWHTSNILRTMENELLAKKIVNRSFANSVFFCNSGAEAVDTGIKMIRKYFKDKNEKNKYRFIVAEQGFHGRTIGAISAGGQEKLIKGFEPVLEGFDKVKFNDISAVENSISENTAAIFIEPIQGEGGIIPASKEYLINLRKLADEKNLLLFFDEVQTGIGRTGDFLSFEWAGIEPDVVAVGKGLGSGFPVGACLAKGNVSSALTVGSHGTTLGGNPLGMAIANKVLDEMDQKFLNNIKKVSSYFLEKLKDTVFKNKDSLNLVRGRGLMLGLKCIVSNKVFQEVLASNGLLTVTAGDNVIRLLPPLTVNKKEIDEAINIINHSVNKMNKNVGFFKHNKEYEKV
tara:strand:- start:2067 stop:3278 length:1212 start_codon:yes stop_codon:yes gene_type:complete